MRSELQKSMSRIFSILLFITCAYSLGRMPSPILTTQLKKASTMSKTEKSRTDKKIEKRTGKKPNREIFKKKKEANFFSEKSATSLFNLNRYNRPSRYIKNNLFEHAVRNSNLIMYQTIAISLLHRNKHQTTQRYQAMLFY
jgi:hypothetical protein